MQGRPRSNLSQAITCTYDDLSPHTHTLCFVNKPRLTPHSSLNPSYQFYPIMLNLDINHTLPSHIQLLNQGNGVKQNLSTFLLCAIFARDFSLFSLLYTLPPGARVFCMKMYEVGQHLTAITASWAQTRVLTLLLLLLLGLLHSPMPCAHQPLSFN